MAQSVDYQRMDGPAARSAARPKLRGEGHLMTIQEKRELFGTITLFARVDVVDEWLHGHRLGRLARRSSGAWMARRLRRTANARRLESNGAWA
jgi:predicted Ser/Thr protein kinase